MNSSTAPRNGEKCLGLRDGGKALHRKHKIDQDHKNCGGANSREHGQRDTGTRQPRRGTTHPWIEFEESRRQHEKAESSGRHAHYVRHGDIRHRSGHFDPGVADEPNASHEKDGWSPRFEPVRWCCASASREWTITRQKVSVHLRSGCCTRALHLALAHSPISRQILLIHCLR